MAYLFMNMYGRNDLTWIIGNKIELLIGQVEKIEIVCSLSWRSIDILFRCVVG